MGENDHVLILLLYIPLTHINHLRYKGKSSIFCLPNIDLQFQKQTFEALYRPNEIA